MGNTWVTDMRHFLDPASRIAEDMSRPGLNLALFLGSIVAWVTSGRTVGDRRTNVACRRNPGRQRCRGVIEAELDPDGDAISWHCPVCRDNGVTRGWKGTPWDRRPRGGR